VSRHSPYLKLHGCSTRPLETVWTASQFDRDPIKKRLQSLQSWIAANLREKDLIFIGFWSDWSYLNSLLERVLNNVQPSSILIVSPADYGTLECKARRLWRLIHASGARIQHMQMSGDQFLNELRIAFSQVFVSRALKAGMASFTNATGAACGDGWFQMANESETLYAIRRNVEGVPRSAPASLKRPPASEPFGCCHLLLKRAGALETGADYALRGRTIRVINGGGRDLESLRGTFAEEAPSLGAADLVIAAGATNLGFHNSIVRSGREDDIVRPAVSGEWVTLEEARVVLEV